jgi:hypothetical protein
VGGETHSPPGSREDRDDGLSSMGADVTGIAAAAAGAVADSKTAAAAEPSCSTTTPCHECMVCCNRIVYVQTYESVGVEVGATSPTHTYAPASKQDKQQSTAIIPSR